MTEFRAQLGSSDAASEIVAPAILTMKSGMRFHASQAVIFGDSVMATGRWATGDGRVKTLSWPKSSVREIAAVDDGWTTR